jgi:hypothetical protein
MGLKATLLDCPYLSLLPFRWEWRLSPRDTFCDCSPVGQNSTVVLTNKSIQFRFPWERCWQTSLDSPGATDSVDEWHAREIRALSYLSAEEHDVKLPLGRFNGPEFRFGHSAALCRSVHIEQCPLQRILKPGILFPVVTIECSRAGCVAT